MTLLIAFLTFVLVINCFLLILLILIQLPKKEAGAGIAFGGAATDALFGAGSGNALTKLTKYAGTFFVGLAVLLSVLNMQAARQGTRRLEQELSKQASTPAPVIPQASSPNTTLPLAPSNPAPAAALQTTPATPATSVLITPATDAAAPASAPLETKPAVTPEAAAPAPENAPKE